MKLSDLKKGMFLRFRYSPDDVIIQIRKIVKSSPKEVKTIIAWTEGGIEQEMTFNETNIGSWLTSE